MLGSQTYISFRESTHQYFDPDGDEYTSVSKVKSLVIPQFDRANISFMMAKKKSKDEGMTLEVAQAIILEDWDKTNKEAIDWGIWIHNNMESYLTGQGCEERLLPVAKRIASFVSPYYKFFTEALIYDTTYHVAGQTDLALQRQKGKYSLVDFFDYKTNKSKGIVFDSVRRKNGRVVKHYNQFLKSPLDHLEHCNYNEYALQLSLYAYMASVTFNIIVGRLGIIFIDSDFRIRMFPVPYMKLDVMALLEHFKDSNKSGWEE